LRLSSLKEEEERLKKLNIQKKEEEQRQYQTILQQKEKELEDMKEAER